MQYYCTLHFRVPINLGSFSNIVRFHLLSDCFKSTCMAKIKIKFLPKIRYQVLYKLNIFLHFVSQDKCFWISGSVPVKCIVSIWVINTTANIGSGQMARLAQVSIKSPPVFIGLTQHVSLCLCPADHCLLGPVRLRPAYWWWCWAEKDAGHLRGSANRETR